jgi:hypothetical protein
MKNKKVREPIATWWKIHSYKPEIDPIQVVAFTGSFVTYLEKTWRMSGPDVFRESRERRDDIFPTFQEARDAAIQRAERSVEWAEADLHRKRTFLGNIRSLKEVA